MTWDQLKADAEGRRDRITFIGGTWGVTPEGACRQVRAVSIFCWERPSKGPGPLWGAPAESELVALEGAEASLLEVQGEADVEEVHVEIEALYPHSLVKGVGRTGTSFRKALTAGFE